MIPPTRHNGSTATAGTQDATTHAATRGSKMSPKPKGDVTVIRPLSLYTHHGYNLAGLRRHTNPEGLF